MAPKAVLYKIVWKQRKKETCDCCSSDSPCHQWKDMERELFLGTTQSAAKKHAVSTWRIANEGQYEISDVKVLASPVGEWLELD